MLATRKVLSASRKACSRTRAQLCSRSRSPIVYAPRQEAARSPPRSFRPRHGRFGADEIAEATVSLDGGEGFRGWPGGGGGRRRGCGWMQEILHLAAAEWPLGRDRPTPRCGTRYVQRERRLWRLG